MIEPIKHRNVSDQVYEQLRDMIYRGDLPPGDRLASERDMANRFKVGRPTVRSAIQRLIDQGLIESRRGVGTFVQKRDSILEKSQILQMLSNEDFSIADCMEVRLALEVKSAELAAKRATGEDIRRIKEKLEQMNRDRLENKDPIQTDISFHMNIAYASKNIVHIHLIKTFYDVHAYAMTYSYKAKLDSLNIDDVIDQQHNQIFESLCDHDSKRAKKAMGDHISMILEICREHGL
jgi:GntR family transcriptional repressor for pyruvate dehydrogenase complex